MAPGQCFSCFSKYFILVANIFLFILGICAAVVVGKGFNYIYVQGFWNSGSFKAFVVIMLIFIFLSSIAGICLLYVKNQKVTWAFFGCAIAAIIFEITVHCYATTLSVFAIVQVSNNWDSAAYTSYRQKFESEQNCCGFEVFNTTNCYYNHSLATANKSCGVMFNVGINSVFMGIELFIIFFLILQVIIVTCAAYMVLFKEDEVETFSKYTH